jgi:hypothetical protein
VDAFEEAKDWFVELRRNAHAVVAHEKDPFAVQQFRRDADLRSAGAAVLDGVADEVLEELDEMGFGDRECRQVAAVDLGAGRCDRGCRFCSACSRAVRLSVAPEDSSPRPAMRV